MAGKVQAGRNITRLKAAHDAVAEMMTEAGIGCDGKALDPTNAKVTEAVKMALGTRAPEVRDLIEAALRASDSLDARRSAVQQAIKTALKAKLRDPLLPADRPGPYVWIRDLFVDNAVYQQEDSDDLFQVPYTADLSGDEPLITLGEPIQVEIAYVPKAAEVVTTEASLAVDYVPLVEAAIAKDGTARLKLIDPGWGSSGYYSAEVLKRDGPKVFPAGLKMYLDHPTPTEEAERPERSVKDLAAILKTPARWDENGPKGPGLYAEAKVYDGHRDALESVAADIGVSIRAAGRAAAGTAEGRNGLIIQEISSARSVDFVTDPGRGGRILALAESRRQTQPTGGDPKSKETSDMKLTESEQALQGQMTSLLETVNTLAGVVGAQAKTLQLNEARTFVRSQLPASLPPAIASRIVEAQAAAPVTREDGTLDAEKFGARIKEAVKAEVDYLRGLGAFGTGITGMGESFEEAATGGDLSADDATKDLAESFQALGYDEKTANIAAKGR